MTSTTTKEAIVGLIAARTEDDQCLQFVYGSTSSLSGAGVATDVELGEFKLVVDEVRFGTLLTPRAVPPPLLNNSPLRPALCVLTLPPPLRTQPATMPGGTNAGPNPLDV